MIFCLPGNLYRARRRASMMTARLESRHRIDMMTCPLSLSALLLRRDVPEEEGRGIYLHVDSSDTSVRLTPSTSHTLLKPTQVSFQQSPIPYTTWSKYAPIGSGTGQHLVDSDNVEGVDSDSQVESLLSGSLDNVLVGANSSSLKSLR